MALLFSPDRDNNITYISTTIYHLTVKEFAFSAHPPPQGVLSHFSQTNVFVCWRTRNPVSKTNYYRADMDSSDVNRVSCHETQRKHWCAGRSLSSCFSLRMLGGVRVSRVGFCKAQQNTAGCQTWSEKKPSTGMSGWDFLWLSTVATAQGKKCVSVFLPSSALISM